MKHLAVLVLVVLSDPVASHARPPQEMPFMLPLPGKPSVRPASSSFVIRHSSLPAESSHSYDVRHYRLDFDLPMTHAGYACHEQVALASNVPSLDTVVLDFDSLTCDSVKRQGAALAFSTPPGRLAILLDAPLPLGDSTVLDIFFRRDSATEQIGYYFCRPPTRIYAHAMTCGCPRDNHYWFACYDHPMDKAERGCAMNLTVPDTFQTNANGLLDSVTVNAGNRTRTYWWRHPYPICTYLMTFSASRFSSWRDTVVNTNGDTIPIIHFVWPSDSAPSRVGFRNVPDMFYYFSDTGRFGPYPFERYGQIPGYYEFPWGGMEHQTTAMLHPTAVNGNDALMAHELSHMWWGDMVTHVGYADVWLNEGFGTYAECMYMGHRQGRAYFNSYIRGKASQAFSQDRRRRFPVYNPPWGDIYNTGTIYCKGAWVQHMLRYVVGDTAWESPGVFFRALRAYRDSFAYGTVSTEDYRRVNEQVTGLELGWFFDEWVYQAGYPRYYVTWNREPLGDTFRVITSVAQQNGTGAPDFFRTPLQLRINCLYVDTTVVVRPRANPQVDTFLVTACPESLTVDPDNWVLDSSYITGIAEGSAGPVPPVLILSSSPNPSSGPVRFAVCGAPLTESAILVHDLAGRLVSKVSYRLTAGGRADVVWDRTDLAGRRVPSGVYFCRLSSVPSAEATRLTLLR